MSEIKTERCQLGHEGCGFGERGTDLATWTLAYRRKGARTFRRVTDWAGTWHEAFHMAGDVGEWTAGALDIYYVPTLLAECRQAARTGFCDDVANVMLSDGRRVPVTETGRMSDLT